MFGEEWNATLQRLKEKENIKENIEENPPRFDGSDKPVLSSSYAIVVIAGPILFWIVAN